MLPLDDTIADMFDPFSGSIYVRGEVIGKDATSLNITFRQSSAFWDESDIGKIGGQLKLTGVKNTDTFNLGDKVIGYGQVERTGVIDAAQVYPSSFQPFDIDWKITFWTIVITSIGFIIYQVYWKWLLTKIRKLKH